jgi:hypothetical protein
MGIRPIVFCGTAAAPEADAARGWGSEDRMPSLPLSTPIGFLVAAIVLALLYGNRDRER